MPWCSCSVVGLEAVEVVDGRAVVERGGVVGDGGQLDGHGAAVRPRGGPGAAGSAGSTTAR